MAFVLYSSLFIFRHDFQGMACYPRRTFNPLSESPSTQDSQITMVDFCLCSTSRSHSQAGLYHYHHSKILAWAYLRTPPLLFRRHPPQINYPPRSVLPPPPSRLSESASDVVFDLIATFNSAISFVPRIFRDPVHFPFFLPRIEFILTIEISHSQVIEGQEREERLGLGSLDP